MADVRRAGLAEWEAIRDVRLRALADAPTAFGPTLARELAFDEAEWQRRAGAEYGAWFLAWDGDRPAGVVFGLRGEGCHELLRCGSTRPPAAPAWAAGDGATLLVLGVTEGDDAARRLYAARRLHPDRQPRAAVEPPRSLDRAAHPPLP